ncbi:MAG: DUF2520 domain-containing protein [Bacteroidales bacterium]|nr:DUF2520 domain-containing protein [Bacteroidales bacterium]MCL2133691.1 DUF2520 domain-containing protein [Bacteroidales bacterium]
MKTLSFIGSGNVATHLAKAFFAKGCSIAEIYSRTPAHAERLAIQVGAEALSDVKALGNADIYIMAVEDKAIPQLVAAMPPINALVLHTAGAVDLQLLEKFANHGVLYPLQSLHRERSIDMSAIPFLIEANTGENITIVSDLVGSLSSCIRYMDSVQRRQVHLAAVFASNFVNALLASSCDIAGKNFSLLEPLVRNTVEKAFQAQHPKEVQTGPALRGDEITMNRHLELLQGHHSLQEAYRLLSKLILNIEPNVPYNPKS